MIPTASDYPEKLDTDTNLFMVHDALRLRLVEDYLPGDTTIKVEGNFLVFDRMPPTGLITLTEQCSDIDERALTFFYNGWNKDEATFTGLEILPGFTDIKKPKRITNVTMNVMDKHHNHLKNALIKMQQFFGIKGEEDKFPFGATLESRINFLRRLVLQPKAWFTSDKRTGNVPLEIEFRDQSFRLATDGTTDNAVLTWDFGDQSISVISLVSLISTISATSVVPDNEIDVYVRDTDKGTIKKTYHQPGIYAVKLTAENDFGKDVIVFEDYINARVKAPDPAIIRLVENASNQEGTPGVPPDGPFETVPKIRSPINTLIRIEVEEGENPATPNVSYAGEQLNASDEAIDEIVNWTWALGDDLNHPSARATTASYSIGGIYDLKLRVDTEFGAFRITTYEDAIDIVENTNLWLWVFQNSNTVRSYEYGLISETFKLSEAPSFVVSRNDSFLTGQPEEAKQKSEFRRNTGFTPRGSTSSGQGGSALLYWASGRNVSDPTSLEKVNIVEFDGFSHSYISKTPFQRQWNWAALNSPQATFFIFGAVPDYPPSSSPTNTNKQTLNFNDLTVSSEALVSDNYLNGSSELTENVSIYDGSGTSIYGDFSVYRTAWRDGTGYILRNDGVGPFFRIKNFYRTEGSINSPFTNIRKLQDIQGPTKLEGQLVNLSQGVYFLNNSGSVSEFTPTDSIWHTGGPGVNSLLYRNLQDTTVLGYDNPANTLLAASDSDKRAYLSFDYSASAFLRFSEIDLTFATLGTRPEGQQWIMGVN